MSKAKIIISKNGDVKIENSEDLQFEINNISNGETIIRISNEELPVTICPIKEHQTLQDQTKEALSEDAKRKN